MADAKPPAKILRVLGNRDAVLERTHVGIYDYLDSLTSLAFTHSVALETPIQNIEAYTTIETVGFPFTKRRLLNFAGPFLISDDVANQRTNVDIGLFSTSIKGAVSASGGGSTNFLRADGVWAPPPGGGITQLTGDVTAGPGSGSQVATLANIPDGVPAAGTIVFATIGTPAIPAAGHGTLYASTSNNIAHRGASGVINHGIQSRTLTASNWINAIAADGSTTISQPAFADISGSLAAGQFGPLTGDVTTSGYAATLASIPNGVPALGSILRTAIAAPATPAAGKAHVYVDSTSLNLAVKNSSGVVNHGVQTRAASASNWIRSIADDGSSTISQPAFTDISGSVALSQLGNGSALSVLGVAGSGAATRADIAASAASGFALRENGAGVLGFGTLTTGAYGANTVTYAKIQTTGAGNVLLGRGTGGAGNVTELAMSGQVAIGGSTVVFPKQISMSWGGLLGSIGTQLASSSFYLAIGDNAWSTASNFGFFTPNASTSQDWGIIIFANTLAGTGSPTFSVSLMVGAVAVATLATFSGSGGVPTGSIPSTTQTWSAGTIIGIRIAVASGTINAGTLGIYVVGRCSE